MVRITNHYGIVVRLKAFNRIGISLDDFVKKTEASLIERDGELVSFGPCFGQEAGDRITDRMEALGFEFVTDYWVMNFDIPDWIILSAHSATTLAE